MNDQEAHEFYADPEHLETSGPGRKHPKDELTEFLSARISPSLLGQVTRAAVSEERSVGSWVRRALRNELERSGWKAAERQRRKDAGEGGRVNADDVAAFERQLREAMTRGAPVRLLTPLPRKVRLRLWYSRQVDKAAIWLVDRGRLRAAEGVWRTFGKWR